MNNITRKVKCEFKAGTKVYLDSKTLCLPLHHTTKELMSGAGWMWEFEPCRPFKSCGCKMKLQKNWTLKLKWRAGSRLWRRKCIEQLLMIKAFYVQVTELTERDSDWPPARKASAVVCCLARLGKALVRQRHRAASLPNRREDMVLFVEHLSPRQNTFPTDAQSLS